MMDKQLVALLEKQKRVLDRAAEPDAYLNEADLRRQIEEVVREYEEIIAKNPRNVVPYILYGKLLRQVGEREHAQNIFLAADQIDSNVAVVKQQLANYYTEEEQPHLAFSLFQKARQLDPSEPVYDYSLAELLVTYRDRFVADKTYTFAEIDRDIISLFDNAAKKNPEIIDFVIRKGEAYYDVDDPDWSEALKVWNQVESKARTDTLKDIVKLHKARVLSEMGRYDEARVLAAAVETESLQHSKELLLEEMNRQKGQGL